MSFRARLYLACLAFAAWTALLWVGWSAGGWAHALLGAALVAFPWRVEAASAPGAGGVEEEDGGEPP